MKQNVAAILAYFEAFKGPKKELEGMARFGINAEKAFGVRTPDLRRLAKEIGKNHELALELWDTEYRESRILASMIGNPRQLDVQTMDKWVSGFNSWDVCDSCCGNLFRHSPMAWDHIERYAKAENEWTRRTGFVLLAELAVGDKTTADAAFLKYLPLIERYATDSRNFVKKAVNWALRQMGKRNLRIHPHALELAQRLKNSDNKTARWIGSDAYRELASEKIIARIKP